MTTNQSTKTTPSYAISQRLIGYADNDGRFTVERIAPLHWSRIGTLQRTGSSRFVGVFDTLAAAEAAATADLSAWATETKSVQAVR